MYYTFFYFTLKIKTKVTNSKDQKVVHWPNKKLFGRV